MMMSVCNISSLIIICFLSLQDQRYPEKSHRWPHSASVATSAEDSPISPPCKLSPTQSYFLLLCVCTFQMAFLCLLSSAFQPRVLPSAAHFALALRLLRWHQSPSSIHSSKSHKASPCIAFYIGKSLSGRSISTPSRMQDYVSYPFFLSIDYNAIDVSLRYVFFFFFFFFRILNRKYVAS